MRSTECPLCHADLHSCKGCKFYAPGNHYDCKETVDDIIQWCVDRGYYGMENLSLIPGEVGASAVQNIGAYGSEAKDVIDCVEAIEISNGEKVIISNADCEYSYRQSKFKNEWKNRFFITYVYYHLKKTFTANIDYGNIRQSLEQKGITTPTAQQLRDVIIEIRKEKLPDLEEELKILLAHNISLSLL